MQEKMKSAVLLGEQTIEVQDKDIPSPKEGELLLKIKACAVCGSDLRIFKSGNERVKPPRIIGHEISAEVVKLGAGVTNYKVGDFVSVGADVPCGNCEHCKNGRPNCCDINLAIGYQFDGGFSQYMIADQLLVKYGPMQTFTNKIPFEEAALAEPLACCINGLERVFFQPNKSVLIFGAGPIGVMLARLAKYNKSKLIMISDPDQKRLDFVKTDVDYILNPEIENIIERVMQLTNQQGCDYIFTACAVVQTHEMALQLVAKRGFINLFGGLPKNSPSISMSSNHIHYREAYVTGSHGSTPDQHKKALKLIEEKQIKVKDLISHRFELKDLKNAFDASASRSGLKVVIFPNGQN